MPESGENVCSSFAVYYGKTCKFDAIAVSPSYYSIKGAYSSIKSNSIAKMDITKKEFEILSLSKPNFNSCISGNLKSLQKKWRVAIQFESI